MALELDKIHLGDCKGILKKIADESIDLIVPSPPYVDNRKSTYARAKEYNNLDLTEKWIRPRRVQMWRVRAQVDQPKVR
jgi:DNA modification methylase